MDTEMIVSILDWMMERFQDALLTVDLKPSLFRRPGEPVGKKEVTVLQFLALMQRAIGATVSAPAAPQARRNHRR
jgi:hypothetical protein